MRMAYEMRKGWVFIGEEAMKWKWKTAWEEALREKWRPRFVGLPTSEKRRRADLEDIRVKPFEKKYDRWYSKFFGERGDISRLK